MSKEKYQISEKAQWLRLSLLADELESYKQTLMRERTDIHSWNQLLRHTRNVFISLHNLSDELGLIHFLGEELLKTKRALRKKLEFACHVRNKGVGHLDQAMSERAVQWMPQLFMETDETEDSILRLAEAQRAVIESCVNSYLDELGVQKEFGNEIDLYYPPNQAAFFEYMECTVEEALSYVATAIASLDASIIKHSGARAKELYSIAGKTEFNLKENSNFGHSESEFTEAVKKAISAMKEMGVDERVISVLREIERHKIEH